MTSLDVALHPVFQPSGGSPIRALVVAGACGNVGLGKLGQLARLLGPQGVPVVALDPSAAVLGVKDQLRKAFGDRFDAATVQSILDGITVVQGGVDDIPAELRVGFVFEAIPERLALKHDFYAKLRTRDADAWIFSATSGLTTRALFGALPGKERCGVLHPFFPHLTNKLFELPVRDATTGAAELKIIKKLLASLGMSVLPVRDVAAFAADRIFCGMMLEAVRIHEDTGLSPAQIDDVCKDALGTSPFFVHNLIRGANYLSAHCMELMAAEVSSTLYRIPAAWQPYVDDPTLQWPYERGQKCPAEQRALVHDRMVGMLSCLLAGMVAGEVAPLDAINFLCENALAFREGVPALAERIGLAPARELAERFLREQNVTLADQVAPLSAFDETTPGWRRLYVGTSVHEGVGLLSLKRATLSHTMLDELDLALDQLDADPNVRAIVLAPDGTFSRELGHGADLQAFVPVLGDQAAALALIVRWKQTLAKLRGKKPTVAAMVGRVLGGGLELAANCTARIAAQRTKLAFPETTVGVIPGLGGCHLLHRQSAESAWPRIDEILLTGHGFSAEEAAGWGFVSEVVPVGELPAKSMALARALASGERPVPALRRGPAKVKVDRTVSGKNEAGVALDADLRELLATTIEDANAATIEEGSRIEEERAAQSLAMSSSKIGVAAALRGKPPAFARPIG